MGQPLWFVDWASLFDKRFPGFKGITRCASPHPERIGYNFHVFTPDYLAIGHLSHDLTPNGPQLGGSVAYAARTARAMGLRVGIVTSHSNDVDLTPLEGIACHHVHATASTTFIIENTPQGRQLHLTNLATPLRWEHIPTKWRRASIIHLAPIAQEFSPSIAQHFAGRFIGVTPQGWLRQWQDDGRITPTTWAHAQEVLSWATAAVVSLEDLNGDESQAIAWAKIVPVLVVTQGAQGAVLYWQSERRHIPAPTVSEIDATGAGDIFAAAFFVRLYHTRDPLEAARFATVLAAASVQRLGLKATPSPKEIQQALKA